MAFGGGSRRRFVTLLTLAVGFAIIGWLLHRAGLTAILDRLRELGWAAPLLLVPHVVATTLDVLGWRLTLPSTPPVPLGGLILTRMAGEAVNSLTPAAGVGEPVKAYLLRRWRVPAVDALASVVISKTALISTQALFTALGVPALLWRIDRPQLATAWLILLSAGCALFTALLVWVQHRGPGAAIWKLLRRVAPRASLVGRLEAGSSSFDERLRAFYGGQLGVFFRASWLHFVGWLIGVFEVVMMMRLMGSSVSWLDAFIIETLGQLVRAAAIVVPAGIGTQELGGVALCRYLGMSEADAVTLWLLRRGRETVFDVVGLLYLAHRGSWRTLKAR